MNKSIILFGVGYWGKNHLRELNANPLVSSILVVDPIVNKESDILQQYKNVNFYTTFEEALSKNKNIDGAIIATPPSTHFDIAKKCLENNLHVLIEKPMVETLKELDILNELASDNKVLMSGHTYLYNSAKNV